MSNSLTLWEQEMAESAKAQAADEQSAGFAHQLKFKGGGLMFYDKDQIRSGTIDAVILAATFENQYYTGEFDPDVIQTPECYAVGTKIEDMVPSQYAENPQVDVEAGEKCSDCRWNQMGTAEKGKGKACKNVRKMIIIPASAAKSADEMMSAEECLAKVPVTSVRNLSKYIKTTLAEEVRRPTFGVVTTISSHPHPKHQLEVKFEFNELIDFNQELYEATKRRADSAAKQLADLQYPKLTAAPVEEKPKAAVKVKAKYSD